MRHEGGAHLGANFEGVRADGRPHPGQHLAGRPVHGGHRGFQHAGAEATPAGMGRGDTRAGAVAEQHRQAVGRHDGADHARGAGDARVGLRRVAHVGGVQHARAMHLGQPGRFGRQAGTQEGAVLRDMFRRIADMVAEVHAVEGGGADAARARGDQGAHAGRCFPVRVQPLRRGQVSRGHSAPPRRNRRRPSPRRPGRRPAPCLGGAGGHRAARRADGACRRAGVRSSSFPLRWPDAPG